MKTIAACLFMIFGVFTANAESINQHYAGRAEGSITQGEASLKDGPVEVQLSNLSLFKNPLRYFSERKLTLHQGDQNFQFIIPEKAVQKDGSFSAEADSVSINASLEKRLVGQSQEVQKLECTFVGHCYNCQLKGGQQQCTYQYSASCSGQEEALMQINLYDSTLRLQLKSASGSAEVQSTSSSSETGIRLKTVKACND
jgi:hypothetical protein